MDRAPHNETGVADASDLSLACAAWVVERRPLSIVIDEAVALLIWKEPHPVSADDCAIIVDT